MPHARVEDQFDLGGQRYRVTALLDQEIDDSRQLWWFVTAYKVAA